MKKVDIRVMGKIELDMNTLTDVARERAEKLFERHNQLIEYRGRLWWNNKQEIINIDGEMFIEGSNSKALRETWDKINMVEYDLTNLIKDRKSYRGLTLAKIGHGILKVGDNKWFDLMLFGVYLYSYIESCATHNIISAICFGYLTMFWFGLFVNKSKKLNSKEVV